MTLNVNTKSHSSFLQVIENYSPCPGDLLFNIALPLRMLSTQMNLKGMWWSGALTNLQNRRKEIHIYSLDAFHCQITYSSFVKKTSETIAIYNSDTVITTPRTHSVLLLARQLDLSLSPLQNMSGKNLTRRNLRFVFVPCLYFHSRPKNNFQLPFASNFNVVLFYDEFQSF